ncbi:DUF4297 domain-containing protein [Rhodococcus erythropolis]|uniref:ABC-three component system protein n=1 Tax=Rhodococcus erythropolis TaxID=1833 RepID=UPI001F2023EF|nr:ABC-three component system protein [Rhodococcus erythropolis]UJC78954.1 DUF4297 domain-containing protein [Rhodococcus erythropolis]
MAGHNAAGSAAGYLYQTNWALMDLLRKGNTRPDQAITLELHDDVAWTSAVDVSDPSELLQLKLHTTSKGAGLGDKAVDIWKTLRVWMDRPDAYDPQGPALALITTSVATTGSAAHALRPLSKNVDQAIESLLTAARESTNEVTQETRDMFVALDSSDRFSLLSRVEVLDGEMPPEDLDQAVRESLAYVLPTGGRLVEDRFVAQVWHHWAAIAVDMLAGRRALVMVTEIRTFVRELRNRYTTENLPTTVPLAAVSDVHVNHYADWRFVTQLSFVNYAGPALRNAIIDYHRAVTQETEWLSDSLLELQELRTFEDELRFEWTREFSNMVDDLELDHLDPADAETLKRKAGRKFVNYILNSTAVTVRTHYNEGFYARGKRHELAGHDDVTQRIGWHPDFVERLEALASG